MGEEKDVGYVRKGVDVGRWCGGEWKKVLKENFDEKFLCEEWNEKMWEGVYGMGDEEIWNRGLKEKGKLVEYMKRKWRKEWVRSEVDGGLRVWIFERLNGDGVVIGLGGGFGS